MEILRIGGENRQGCGGRKYASIGRGAVQPQKEVANYDDIT